MPLHVRLPDPLAYIYSPHPILPEDTVLDTEEPGAPFVGEVRIRALNGFIFVKDGRFVYPRYNLPKRWWNGVLAYGYMSALTGDYKHFIWAGQWNEDYDGKHVEVVVLGNLLGLSKERSKHWRKNLEHVLWLETKQGYTYALLEPAEEYNRGGWDNVTNSWINLRHPKSRSNPSFTVLSRQDPRPKWWGRDGDRAWKHWVSEPEIADTPKSGQATLSLESWAARKKITGNNLSGGTSTVKPKATNTENSLANRTNKGVFVSEPSRSDVKLQKQLVEPILVEDSSDDESLAPSSPSIRESGPTA